MYPCPGCGSDMKYDPSRQKLYCEYCGNTLDAQTADNVLPTHNDTKITPEKAMSIHQAAASDENEITPARLRYEAYLAKKAEQDQKGDSLSTNSSVSPAAATSTSTTTAAVTTTTTTTAAVPKTKKETAKNAAPKIRPTYQTHIFTCPSCGAELLSTEETVATFCSYCGNSVLLQSRMEEADCPDYVIPFQISKEACEKAYRRLLRRALFVPSEMKEDTQIERFRGIYMPYWIYSFEKDGSYNVAGTKSRRRGDYVYTKHYRLQSHMTAECKGLSYDASSTFADNLSSAIAPYNTEECTAFHPAYLSGFYADRGDVNSSTYYHDALDTASEYVADQVNKKPIYRKYHVSRSSMSAAFHPKAASQKLGFFPVWFLGCRSHDGKRISYAVVNGQNGKIAADLPIDFKKYLIGSLLLAIPLFFLLNAFLTLTPTKALVSSIVLALFSLFLSNRQMNQIYTRDRKLDDRGLQSVSAGFGIKNGKTKKQRSVSVSSSIGGTFLRILGIMAIMWLSIPALGILLSLGLFRSGISTMITLILWFILMIWLFKALLPRATIRTRKRQIYAAPMRDKWKYLYKPLLSIGIALLILLIDPVSDLYYYIGAAVSLGCVIWSFFDIINEHNLLTTRQLPQMGKRGGDENA